MMHSFLGEEVFRRGVSKYLKKHAYGNAEQDDLWAALTEEAARAHALPDCLSVKMIMDTWTVQSGYPVVTVERDYDRGVANISQVPTSHQDDKLTLSSTRFQTNNDIQPKRRESDSGTNLPSRKMMKEGQSFCC